MLFYSALRLQQKEFQLQRTELSSQRKEFTINRLTNVIYKQLELINNSINIIKYNDKIYGANAIINLNSELNQTIQSLDSAFTSNNEKLIINKKRNSIDTIRIIQYNYDNLTVLLDSIHNTHFVIDKLFNEIKNDPNINGDELKALKVIYSENVPTYIKKLIEYLSYILNNNDWNTLSINDEYKLSNSLIAEFVIPLNNFTQTNL